MQNDFHNVLNEGLTIVDECMHIFRRKNVAATVQSASNDRLQ